MTDATPPSSTSIRLVGAIAVEAALAAGRREAMAVHVDAAMDFRKLEPVRRAAKARGLEMQRRDRGELDAMAGDDKHGGVIAEVGPRPFESLQELLNASGGERVFIVMLDGVEDPFNFGQAIRSLYAAGCHGVVVRPRNWAAPAPGSKASGAEAIVARASAGTSEFMPMAIAETPEEAAGFFASKNVAVVATADDASSQSLYDTDLTGPTFLLIGGEKRGVKRAMLDRADRVVHIPYGRPFEHALGTVAAATVLGFELARQRRG